MSAVSSACPTCERCLTLEVEAEAEVGRGDTTQFGRSLFLVMIICLFIVFFGSLVNWEIINAAPILKTWAVWILQTEADHVVPDAGLRTLKLKKLAEIMVLILAAMYLSLLSLVHSPCNLQPEISRWQPVVSRPLGLQKKGSALISKAK